jgi:hypothetical protein
MKRLVLLVSIVALTLLVTSTGWAQGCSQCRLLAEQGSELDEASFGSTINTGILYLMVIPYLLLMFLFRKKIIGFFKQLAGK